jgi:hypothetical protein
MTDYAHHIVTVYDRLGGNVRTARNSRIYVYSPGTTTVAPGLKQGGVSVQWVTTDENGEADFTETTGVVRLVSPLGLDEEHWSPAYLDEVKQAAADAASSAASAQSSADSAASSAALVGAPAGSAIAANLKAKGTVSDQDYASLEAALADLATGGVLEVSQAWSRSATFTVNKTCTVRFLKGGAITVTSATIAAITVTANDVTIDAPNLTGTGSATSSTGAGIYAAGASATSMLTGLRVERPTIQAFSQNGISLLFCSDFRIRGVRISDVAYGGIMLSSCADGEIAGGSIKNIAMPSPLTNAYGIAASFNETSGITTNPQSRDINIHDVTVDGVPGWEGIDTHAGINIKVHHNTVRNCKVGIAIVPGRNGGGSYVLAPKNCSVSSNFIDSGRSDGVLSQGISFVGCSTATGFHNNTDWATGVITGNTIRRCGNDAATSGAAVSLQDTLGVVVSGNRFDEPVVSAIRLDYNNKDVVVQGNSCTDVWTNASSYAVMIQTGSSWNTATVTGNTLTRGSKSATIVNSIGLRIGNAIAALIVEQGNNFLAATTPYSLASPIIRFDQRGIRHCYLTALPTNGVFQAGAQALLTAPPAGGSPGWVCTTAGGASSATWAATTAYSNATWVKTSTGKVLECVGAGTSSGTEPNPSTIDGVVTDGTVTWVYRAAASAVFKALPNVAA